MEREIQDRKAGWSFTPGCSCVCQAWRLLFLALGHLLIMHIIHNVDNIDFQFVAARYATPFWRTYDLVMLWLAMIHGVNGIRTVLVDYIARAAGGWPRWLRFTFWDLFSGAGIACDFDVSTARDAVTGVEASAES